MHSIHLIHPGIRLSDCDFRTATPTKNKFNDCPSIAPRRKSQNLCPSIHYINAWIDVPRAYLDLIFFRKPSQTATRLHRDRNDTSPCRNKLQSTQPNRRALPLLPRETPRRVRRARRRKQQRRQRKPRRQGKLQSERLLKLPRNPLRLLRIWRRTTMAISCLQPRSRPRR